VPIGKSPDISLKDLRSTQRENKKGSFENFGEKKTKVKSMSRGGMNQIALFSLEVSLYLEEEKE